MVTDRNEVTDADELMTEAVASMTKAVIGRLELELHGAWRAGYNFLYVVTDRGTLSPSAARGSFSTDDAGVSKVYIPSQSPRLRPPDQSVKVERYDLRDVTRAEVENTIR